MYVNIPYKGLIQLNSFHCATSRQVSVALILAGLTLGPETEPKGNVETEIGGFFCGREVFLSGEHEHGVVFFFVVEMFI